MNSGSPGRGRQLNGKFTFVFAALIILVVSALASCTQETPSPTPPPVSTAPAEAPSGPSARPTDTSPGNILGPAPVSDTTFLHEPFEEEQCGTCHDLQNQENPQALWASSVVEACRLCHWQLIDSHQPSNIHEPFPQGQCLTCHNPHASGQAFLLTKPQGELCRDCHTTPRNQPHPPTAEEECVLCHAGHGSEQEAILREPQAELCIRCHADHVQENAAFRPHAQAATDCALCHNPHTGEMVDNVAEEGCRQCHADVFTAEVAVSHAPVQAGFCTTCHDFHQQEQFALLTEPQPDVCRQCHAVGNPVEQTHPPTAQGECSLCHAGHGGDYQALLRKTESEVCATCHDVSTHGNVDTAFHAEETFQVDCTACHNPHGPVGNLAQIRDTINGQDVTFTARTGQDSFDEPDDDNADDLCATCHTQTSHNRVPSNREDVGHYEGGTCTMCHPHNLDDDPATVDGFMLDKGFCIVCHGTPPPPAAEGYALDEEQLPHQLHAGADGLGYDCQTCHDTSARRYAGHNTTPASFQDVWFDESNPGGRYDAGERSCGGVYCHSNGAAARTVPGEPTYATAVWTEPESAACGTCHGVDQETLTTGIHDGHLSFADCETCHTGYGEPTHVNRQIDFSDGETLPDTEVCSQCHGDQAPAFKQLLLEPEE